MCDVYLGNIGTWKTQEYTNIKANFLHYGDTVLQSVEQFLYERLTVNICIIYA